MLILFDTEYTALKAKIKNEILQEMQNEKQPTYTQIAQQEYTAIFERHFGKSKEETLCSRLQWYKIRSALSTANNVLRPQIRKRLHKTEERSAHVRSEPELAAALETFEALCVAFRSAFQPDIMLEEDDQ